jgi:hypothetical protein
MWARARVLTFLDQIRERFIHQCLQLPPLALRERANLGEDFLGHLRGELFFGSGH